MNYSQIYMFKEQLLQCHQNILPYVHNTPVLTSRSIDKIIGAKLFFKCENFQKTGSFKIRGATNALINLTNRQKMDGVVTHSSGNFAQAISYAAQRLGIKAYIVMPWDAPQVKKNAVMEYGGIIVECRPTLGDREETAKMISNKHGATFVHPSDDFNVILGQATSGKEFLELRPDMDYLFVPVGGGGLVSGTIIAVNCCGSKTCKVIGGEPFEVDDAYRSLKSGTIESNVLTNTIADGLKTKLGTRTFPIIRDNIHKIVRVHEEDIIKAMKLIWERMKIIIEPSSAVAVAALIKEKKRVQGKKIGVILSGGNVDFSDLPF